MHPLQRFSIADKIAESNRIEGIVRDPTPEEIQEYGRFNDLPLVRIADLENFVTVYQPGARLRTLPGENVRVGNHFPPHGGPDIAYALQDILDNVNGAGDPWEMHLQYETLHPFTDGNGRSGRMLWYYMMRFSPQSDLGFLHAFYYQTLRGTRR